jgi:hypothetical protein
MVFPRFRPLGVSSEMGRATAFSKLLTCSTSMPAWASHLMEGWSASQLLFKESRGLTHAPQCLHQVHR